MKPSCIKVDWAVSINMFITYNISRRFLNNFRGFANAMFDAQSVTRDNRKLKVRDASEVQCSGHNFYYDSVITESIKETSL